MSVIRINRLIEKYLSEFLDGSLDEPHRTTWNGGTNPHNDYGEFVKTYAGPSATAPEVFAHVFRGKDGKHLVTYHQIGYGQTGHMELPNELWAHKNAHKYVNQTVPTEDEEA